MLKTQKTIKREFSLQGAGLHTGHFAHLTFKPAPENSGISFIRVDLPGRPVIEATSSNICTDTGVPRCTTIGRGQALIHTIEHLMSVLCGLEISNLTIEIDANELPGLDGSGIDYLKAFRKVGLSEQKATVEPFKIQEPIGIEHNGSMIYVVPADELKISYMLSYDHPFLKSQFFSLVVNPQTFEKEIAPCRTFCLEGEAEELRKLGLGKGATYENTLVVSAEGVKENTVRFPEEFARHKILDFMGDIYLLGVPLQAHVFAIRSGHTLNINLLQKLQDMRNKSQKKKPPVSYDFGDKKEIDIQGIMKILPHRYPFLLVDRVIEIEKGKRAVGIKNVTMNDIFFQGHFPTRPIMPGVLMVEAMAQTAGVVVLTNEAHHGKVAFFMAADNVKFRKLVVPGDQLVMEVEITRDKSKIAQIHALAKVDDEIVAEADMIFSFTDASFLDPC